MVREVRVSKNELLNEFQQAKRKMPSLMMKEFLTLKGIREVEKVEYNILNGNKNWFKVKKNWR